MGTDLGVWSFFGCGGIGKRCRSPREALSICPVFLEACFVTDSVQQGMGEAEGSGSASLPPQLSSSIPGIQLHQANLKTNFWSSLQLIFLCHGEQKKITSDNITYSRLRTENLAVHKRKKKKIQKNLFVLQEQFFTLLGAVV